MTKSITSLYPAIGLLLLASIIVTGCAPHAVAPTPEPTNTPPMTASTGAQQLSAPIYSGAAPPPGVARDIAEQQTTQRPQ